MGKKIIRTSLALTLMLALAFVALPSGTMAWDGPAAMGARIEALGGAGSALPGDGYSLLVNPAALGSVKKRSALSLYVPAYGLGATFSILGFTLPVSGNLAVSMAWSRFNDTLDFKYIEDEVQLGTGWQMWPGFALGLRTRLSRLDSVATASGKAVDLGLLAQVPGRSLHIGAVVENVWDLTRYSTGRGERKMPVPQLGLSFAVAPNTLVAVDATGGKDLAAGFETWLGDHFAVRGGIQPDGWSCGLGLRLDRVQADYAYRHTWLGDDHTLSAVFWF